MKCFSFKLTLFTIPCMLDDKKCKLYKLRSWQAFSEKIDKEGFLCSGVVKTVEAFLQIKYGTNGLTSISERPTGQGK